MVAPGSVPNRSSNTDLMVIGGPAEAVRIDGLFKQESCVQDRLSGELFPHPSVSTSCKSDLIVLKNAVHSL